MIDVGRPFSKPFQSVVDALVNSLELGVEQPASREILFRSSSSSYPIGGSVPVSGLASQITGFVAGKPAVFNLGQHYDYAAGQLIWRQPPPIVEPEVAQGWYPDDNSRLNVGYYYRDLPSGITDFNAGSVAGTLVRATARELKLLYEQMDQAYRRAFVDYAEGTALDNVAALMGVTRNQALPAQGSVTFSLKKAPKVDVPIAVGTRVADARGRLFKVTAPGVLRATLEETLTAFDGHVHASVPIGGGVRVRVRGGSSDLLTVPTLPNKPFGDDGRTIKLAAPPPSPTLIVSYQPKTPKVTVPVIALETGPDGNLGSGSLTVMPTPPRGVDGGVVNEEPLTGGEAQEPDDQLRERTKHALERAGNATLNAVRFAVLSVDGVDSVDVRDFSVDEAIPLGELWVRFSTGKSDVVAPQVLDAVERTRAAGVKARVTEVARVTLSGKVYVIPDSAGGGLEAYARYQAAVVSALGALRIGEPVSARKLAAQVFQITGLADVAEVQLDFASGSDPAQPIAVDPFVLDAGAQAFPDSGKISVAPLQTLAVSDATLAPDGALTLTLRALDDTGTAIHFRGFRLATLATIRGKPAATPNQPVQQVAQVAGMTTFDDAEEATPELPTVTIPNLGSLDPGSLEISIQAAAYPGVAAGTTHLARGT